MTTPTAAAATRPDRAHLDRLVAAMARAGLDALLLGHEDNVRWVTGAPRLRLTGTRPFAPACVVVRATRSVHVLAPSDAGLPPFVGVDRVYAPSWDPGAVLARVAAVPGLLGARTVGTDGVDPVAEDLLARHLPAATFVDGEAVVRATRRTKSAADLAGIATAVAVAQQATVDTVDGIAPGVTGDDLTGRFARRLGGLGQTMPALTPTVGVAAAGPHPPPGTRAPVDGDLVHLRGAVLVDGWLGLVTRTRAVGTASPVQEAAARSALEVLRLVTGACRPGRTLGPLRARDDVHALEGLGQGLEPVADEDPLRVDDVLWIEVAVDGAWLGDVVHVGVGATTPLGTMPYGLG